MPVVVNAPFDRLAKLGPDGKITRIDGVLDILAIPRNTFIDQATRDRIRPLVKTWQEEVDQLAIDNLDFMEQIEPSDGSTGIIETVNINDMQSVHRVAEMMTQLMSAGPLSNHLEMKEAFTREQSQRNQEIVSDYLQQIMNEIMAEAGKPAQGQERNEEQKVTQVNAVSHFLYYISCRDSIESFHRQLEEAAPIMSQCVGGSDAAKLKDAIAACKSASTPAERRKASRTVLDGLTFDQRRAALSKAREILGPADPIATLGPPIPPPPGAGQPVNQQPAAPAALPAGGQPIK
jgi:hypothetical protein